MRNCFCKYKKIVPRARCTTTKGINHRDKISVHIFLIDTAADKEFEANLTQNTILSRCQLISSAGSLKNYRLFWSGALEDVFQSSLH